ncbi:MAG TPA: riboflavin synthase [Gammaproteobacteria bacterium]|nr:riboflavin synthase [Gammaproteobacteria bacterium]
MFSGIVKGVGRILELRDLGGDRRAVISYAGVPLGRPAIGASIAVNGVCLTAVGVTDERFEADVSAETLAVTALGDYPPGANVNLEASLRLGDPLDGHLVSGHVDGVGRVIAIEPAARSAAIAIEAPAGLARFIAIKGSVAIDGVSLTVNRADGQRFEVNVVPHTREVTIIGGYRVGTAVNIEVDMLARYVERMLAALKAAPSAGC